MLAQVTTRCEKVVSQWRLVLRNTGGVHGHRIQLKCCGFDMTSKYGEIPILLLPILILDLNTTIVEQDEVVLDPGCLISYRAIDDN